MNSKNLLGLVLALLMMAMFGCGGGGGSAVGGGAGGGGTTTSPAPQFTITATAGAGGAISPSGAVLVTQGANQTFTSTPNPGFFLSDVMVDGASQGAVTSFTFTKVTSNHTINPVFVAGQPATATVTLATQGTLPTTVPPTSIGRIVAVMNYAQNKGLSIVAANVLANGADGWAFTPAPVPPDPLFPFTQSPNLTIAGQVGFDMTNGAGAATTGVFATATFAIAPGNFPTAADFSKGPGFTVLDLNSVLIPGFTDGNFVLGPVIIQ